MDSEDADIAAALPADDESNDGQSAETKSEKGQGADDRPSPMLLPVPIVKVRRRSRISRLRLARLIAEGCTTAEIARELGYSRQHVWRLVRHSQALGRAVDDADAQVDFDATGRLMGVRPIVADQLVRQAAAGETRVVLWLADRLKLAEVAAELKTRAEIMAAKDKEKAR